MLTMYSTPWCGYCYRLKSQLDREGIAYNVVDIEQDAEAAEFVMGVNGGNQTVPTLQCADQPDPASGPGKIDHPGRLSRRTANLTDEPVEVEKAFHRLIVAAEDSRSEGRTTGREWFVTTLEFCDAIADAMGLKKLAKAD
jgi:mycoredoxin